MIDAIETLARELHADAFAPSQPVSAGRRHDFRDCAIGGCPCGR
jgi:hypothetical protein